ncbi:hypothetical protein TYRP_008475 [Tyrophagus putrescentiae]|nr:hypothetical protein TYRP_008475 [Tyrophagus putrescentiae]
MVVVKVVMVTVGEVVNCSSQAVQEGQEVTGQQTEFTHNAEVISGKDIGCGAQLSWAPEKSAAPRSTGETVRIGEISKTFLAITFPVDAPTVHHTKTQHKGQKI